MLSATGYDAWGASWRGDGAPSDPFAYDARWGYYRDPETAYYYCRHRYYDPIGRWITRDPIGQAGGINLYGYCAENPVGRVDPSGLEPPEEERCIPAGSCTFGTPGQGEIELLPTGGGEGRGREDEEGPVEPLPTPAPIPEMPPLPPGPLPPEIQQEVLSGLDTNTSIAANECFDTSYRNGGGRPYIDFTDDADADVMIEPTGSRGGDARAANRSAGFEKTPMGYVWHHHVQRGRMQLIEKGLHGSIAHRGGFGLWGSGQFWW